MRFISAGGLLCLVITLATACQGQEITGEPGATRGLVEDQGDPGEVVETDQAIYWLEWESGAHGSTYALNKGPNTYCAKCHSPLNWDPSAEIDPPPNCVTCKFPNETDMRQAISNPFVTEEDWQQIGCEICHRMENGVADPEPVWLDVRTGFYETVASSSQLCMECHRDNDTLQHARDLGDNAHGDFTCTSCHDAHTLTANCEEGGCHKDLIIPYPGVMAEHRDQIDDSGCTKCHNSVADIHMNILDETPINCMQCHSHLMGNTVTSTIEQGHSEVHLSVSCIACHDASALDAGPTESGEWMPIRAVQLLGRSSTEPYQSHSIQRNVTCNRCHFPENHWGLIADVHDLTAQPSSD